MSIDTSITPKNKTGSNQVHLKKTLLCVATLSALTLMTGQAFANNGYNEVTAEAAGLTLIKQSHNKENPPKVVSDFNAAIKIANTSTPLNGNGKLAVVVDNAKVETIRKTDKFDGFATKHSTNDYWSNISGIMSHGTAKTLWENADIDVTVAKDVKAQNLATLGINNNCLLYTSDAADD